jgi:hypothetical protein
MVRTLWTAAVVVLPSAVTDGQTEYEVRQWCPDATSVDAAVLRLDVWTLTRVGWDEQLWRQADLPLDYPNAYVLGYKGGRSGSGSGQVDQMGYDLLRGLARRLGGRCRRAGDDPWDDPSGEPADPWVFAPIALPAEQTLDMLAPHLPDLHVTAREDGGEYRLDADSVIVWCDPLSPTLYPLVLAQDWYATAAQIVEYQFVVDPGADGPERADQAARALAAVTGGIVLDEDGFPWPRPDH